MEINVLNSEGKGASAELASIRSGNRKNRANEPGDRSCRSTPGSGGKADLREGPRCADYLPVTRLPVAIRLATVYG
jgi:hypothetical protein